MYFSANFNDISLCDGEYMLLTLFIVCIELPFSHMLIKWTKAHKNVPLIQFLLLNCDRGSI